MGMTLADKYRPKSLDDVCGQKHVIKALYKINEVTGLAGQAYWLVGPSASGKTTIARLIAEKVAVPTTTYEVDAQDVSMDMLRDWEYQCSRATLFGGYCIIINEAHGLSGKAVSRLQTILEEPGVQKQSTWVFTTTNRGEQTLFDNKMDACPFLSRCISLRFNLDAKTFGMDALRRLKHIAKEENLAWPETPNEAYLELLENAGFNMRKAINTLITGVLCNNDPS